MILYTCVLVGALRSVMAPVYFVSLYTRSERCIGFKTESCLKTKATLKTSIFGLFLFRSRLMEDDCIIFTKLLSFQIHVAKISNTHRHTTVLLKYNISGTCIIPSFSRLSCTDPGESGYTFAYLWGKNDHYKQEIEVKTAFCSNCIFLQDSTVASC